MNEENHPLTSDLRQDTSEVSERLKVLESKIDCLTPHVLQLENAAIFIVGLIVLLQILDTLRTAQPDAEIARIYWFVPYAALLLVGRVIKVLNPYNRFVEVVETGFSYTGTGALAGGSITGLLSGGLGAPAGAAIGGTIGFVTGIAVGLLKNREKNREKTQRPESMTCQKCNREINKTDKYCERCGVAQSSRLSNCLNCDSTMSVDAQFCPKCGNSRGARDTSSDNR